MHCCLWLVFQWKYGQACVWLGHADFTGCWICTCTSTGIPNVSFSWVSMRFDKGPQQGSRRRLQWIRQDVHQKVSPYSLCMHSFIYLFILFWFFFFHSWSKLGADHQHFLLDSLSVKMLEHLRDDLLTSVNSLTMHGSWQMHRLSQRSSPSVMWRKCENEFNKF